VELPPPSSVHCGIATEVRPWRPPQPDVSTTTTTAKPASVFSSTDYRNRLKTTPAGWPTRRHWCVWLEPVGNHSPASLWDQRWDQAVRQAVKTWQQHLPISLVDQPERAQVMVERKRPPILNNRASHGRALLELMEVKRDGTWRLEPRVRVFISPGQAQNAIQATALHELGHSFGLWGHSDQAGDAMASQPGAQPILTLSERDRRTLQWLQEQPDLGQSPEQ